MARSKSHKRRGPWVSRLFVKGLRVHSRLAWLWSRFFFVPRQIQRALESPIVAISFNLLFALIIFALQENWLVLFWRFSFFFFEKFWENKQFFLKQTFKKMHKIEEQTINKINRPRVCPNLMISIIRKRIISVAAGDLQLELANNTDAAGEPWSVSSNHKSFWLFSRPRASQKFLALWVWIKNGMCFSKIFRLLFLQLYFWNSFPEISWASWSGAEMSLVLEKYQIIRLQSSAKI